jgi:hypothetical protein
MCPPNEYSQKFYLSCLDPHQADRFCRGRCILGMTLASLPVWIVLAVYTLVRNGPPGAGQISQSLLVAIFQA